MTPFQLERPPGFSPLQFDWLGPALPSLAEQALLTAVLAGVFAVGLWIARTARRYFSTEENVRKVNAAIALALFTLAVAVGTSVLSLWADELATLEAFSFLNIENPVKFAGRSVLTVVLLVGVYLFTGVVKDFVRRFTDDSTALTQHQSELVFRSTQVSLYALAVLVVFSVWEVNIGGLLVGAGFLGIVVGLAARQTLGSLLAGFVLMFARPFEIGDWVKIGDREGIVTEISIVNTRIQTFDGEYAMVPNDTVGSSEIINRTRKGRLRVRVDVGVDYETDLDRAREVAKEAMNDVEDILTVPQPQVVLKEFGDSAIVLELRFWIDKPSSRRRWRAQTAVIQSVKRAFDEEDIKIPFPQRELMGRIEEGGFRMAEGTVEAPSEASDVGPAETAPDGGDEE